jgi:hypothetical protein
MKSIISLSFVFNNASLSHSYPVPSKAKDRVSSPTKEIESKALIKSLL